MGAVNSTSSGFESSRLSPEPVVGIASVALLSEAGASVVEGPLESIAGWLLQPVQVNCAEIVDTSGNCVGTITSGGFAPSLQQPIAMGYVSSQVAQNGTALNALVRGKPRTITLTPMPLVPHRYYRG